MSDYLDRLEAELMRGYDPPRRWPAPVAGLALVALVVLAVGRIDFDPAERAVEPRPAPDVMALPSAAEHRALSQEELDGLGIAERGFEVVAVPAPAGDGEWLVFEHLRDGLVCLRARKLVCVPRRDYEAGRLYGTGDGKLFGLVPRDIVRVVASSSFTGTGLLEGVVEDQVWEMPRPIDAPVFLVDDDGRRFPLDEGRPLPPAPPDPTAAPVEVPVGEIRPGIAVRRDGGLVCLEHLDNEVCGSEDQYASGLLFGSRPGDLDAFFGLVPADVTGVSVSAADGRTVSATPRDGVWDATLDPARGPTADVTVSAGRAGSETLMPQDHTWSADDYSVLRSTQNLGEPPPFVRMAGQVHQLVAAHDAEVWAWEAGDRICLAANAFPQGPELKCSPAGEPLPPLVRELPGNRVAVVALLPDGASAFLVDYTPNAVEGLPIRRNLVTGVVRGSATAFSWRAPDGSYVRMPR